MRHTEGKLTVRRENKTFAGHEETHISLIAGEAGDWHRTVATIPVQNDRDANAERLAACWNFCQGVSTEALQTVTLGEVLKVLDKFVRLASYLHWDGDHKGKNEVYFPARDLLSRLQDSPQSAQEAERDEKGEEG